VSTLQLLMLTAVLLQAPLLGVAFLVEFSQRKKRSQREAVEAVRPPSAASTAAFPERGAPPPSPQPPPEQPRAKAAPFEESAGVRKAAREESRAEIPPASEVPLASEAPVVAVKSAPPEEELSAPKVVPHAEAEAPTSTQPEAQAAAAVEPVVEEPEPQAPIAMPARTPVRIGIGLRKTREGFLARIRAAVTGTAKLDEIYEGLEEALIGADVGVNASLKLVEAVRARLKNDARAEVIREALKDEIERMLSAAERPFADSGDAPLVIILAGVNGVGKTTTVAKLAALLKIERGSVVVAAGDTFRAAAIEQLEVWCNRAGVDLIKQNQGSDPAAVAFDAVKAAVARKAKVVIVDTAGRLQTKVNLMEELKKIARVVGRELPGAPHETWLVLDATTGQNALSQAKLFGDAVPLSGVVLAKLDSTAKGGVIVGIAEQLKLPVRYVGLGEGIEDLRPFDPHEFVEALFSEAEGEREAASGTYAA
jgi:fused signal recognition particle receptor